MRESESLFRETVMSDVKLHRERAPRQYRLQAGAEDLGDLVAGQAEPASPETAEFSEADEKVLGQLRSRFSKGEP
jgi:hypothetical protein